MLVKKNVLQKNISLDSVKWQLNNIKLIRLNQTAIGLTQAFGAARKGTPLNKALLLAGVIKLSVKLFIRNMNISNVEVLCDIFFS